MIIYFKNLELLPYFTELYKKNGSIMRINLAGRSYVFLNDPEDIKVRSQLQYIILHIR